MDYIQSNDDSGNLALYAGIGVGAFVGGSALMAYAQRPPSGKGKKRNPGFGDMVYDSNPSYSKGSKQFALGGLANMLSMGKFGGEKRDAGVKQMVDSIVMDHLNKGNYADSIKHLGHALEQGKKTFKGDTKFVTDLMTKGHTNDEIFEELYEKNPFTSINDEDLVGLREKHKMPERPELTDDLLDSAYDTNHRMDADRALKAGELAEAERAAEAAKKSGVTKAAPGATGAYASDLLNKKSNASMNELMSKVNKSDALNMLPEEQLQDIVQNVSDTKAVRNVLGGPTERAPHQKRTPGSAELSDSEKANLARRKEALKQGTNAIVGNAPNAPSQDVPLNQNGRPYRAHNHPANVAHRKAIEEHRRQTYDHWHRNMPSGVNAQTIEEGRAKTQFYKNQGLERPSFGRLDNVSQDTQATMARHRENHMANKSYNMGRGHKSRTIGKRGKKGLIMDVLGI